MYVKHLEWKYFNVKLFNNFHMIYRENIVQIKYIWFFYVIYYLLIFKSFIILK